jgi:hypothetical protein
MDVQSKRPPGVPKFVGKKWLKETMIMMRAGMRQADVQSRVRPLVVVRYSRGGKTRLLQEAEIDLWKLGIPVIRISFNDATPYSKAESDDLLRSLLSRIAYAAMRNPPQWQPGRLPVLVSQDTIVQWLGDSPCVLLIDELNKMLNADNAESVAFFLRDNFLSRPGRYFVFTTHIKGTAGQLTRFMNWPTDRSAIYRQLPLLTSHEAEATAFLTKTKWTPAKDQRRLSLRT